MHEVRTSDIREYAIPAAIFIACVLTRLPFTSRLLYNMDSVQFALALDHFDVTLHQPQPPGYFLYVVMGRLARLITHDDNAALVAVSVLFSGLAAVMLYLLARAIFGMSTGLIASVLVMTSPLCWFHGEVALSYMPEAFMSLLVAYLCYRVLKGEPGLFWAASVALAVAGGIRQNTMVFLFPMWLYSMKGLGFKRALAGLFIFVLTVFVWSAPMLAAAGGYEKYHAALDAHWNDANWRGIHAHWILFNARDMAYFILSGLVLALVPLVDYAFSALTGRTSPEMDRETIYFFLLWLLPPFLFHLIIFSHTAVPGHSLIYMGGLVILSARAVQHVASRIAVMGPGISSGRTAAAITVTAGAVNTLVFLFAPYPLSAKSIRAHDAMLSRYIEAVRSNFSPADTEIIGSGRFILSYRHAMYYLPEFKVFNTFFLTTPDGPRTLWGRSRDTGKTASITFGPRTTHVVDFINYNKPYDREFPTGAKILELGDGDLLVYYDDIAELKNVSRIAPFLSSQIQRRP